jgi:hypothetical protein
VGKEKSLNLICEVTDTAAMPANSEKTSSIVRFKQMININLCCNTCRSEMRHNPSSVNSFCLRYQHIGIGTILPPHCTQQNNTPTAEPVTGLQQQLACTV